VTNVCEACGAQFDSVRPSRACSGTCRVRLWRAENTDRYQAQNEANRGQSLAYYHANAAAQRARNAAYKRRERGRCSERERLRKADIPPDSPRVLERVDREIVYAMHGGCCGICKQYVAPDEFVVDHRIPLSRGGLHGYINCQPAHTGCNQRKYNKLPAQL
jgi:5-methylcytosine-specific restriction endonuclease McrA